MPHIPLSPQACERLVEEIDRALDRRTPTTVAPMFVTSDQLKAWLESWRKDRQLLLFARYMLREMALRLRAEKDA